MTRIHRHNQLFAPCVWEYLNFKGAKPSKSRGAFVEVPYFLSKYDPDALRFYLTATAPETRDTQFSWEEFVERNNNELVATWGNLGQRPRNTRVMLSFACKRFDGKVPEPGELDGEDRKLLAQVEAGFQTVGDLYNACKFRAALGEALALATHPRKGVAREADGYTFATLSAGLDRKAPWFQIKEDPQAAATTGTPSCAWWKGNVEPAGRDSEIREPERTSWLLLFGGAGPA
jgi:methionyl-tRNA synthetase